MLIETGKEYNDKNSSSDPSSLFSTNIVTLKPLVAISRANFEKVTRLCALFEGKTKIL